MATINHSLQHSAGKSTEGELCPTLRLSYCSSVHQQPLVLVWMSKKSPLCSSFYRNCTRVRYSNIMDPLSMLSRSVHGTGVLYKSCHQLLKLSLCVFIPTETVGGRNCVCEVFNPPPHNSIMTLVIPEIVWTSP